MGPHLLGWVAMVMSRCPDGERQQLVDPGCDAEIKVKENKRGQSVKINVCWSLRFTIYARTQPRLKMDSSIKNIDHCIDWSHAN